MKSQFSIRLEEKDLDALKKLGAHEHRSVANMAEVIILQRLENLREEYRHDPRLSSLPKKKQSENWPQEYRDQFGE